MKKTEYINEVKKSLQELDVLHKKLIGLFYDANSHGIEINDVIENKYPFNDSFDEIKIKDWVKSSTMKFDKLQFGFCQVCNGDLVVECPECLGDDSNCLFCEGHKTVPCDCEGF